MNGVPSPHRGRPVRQAGASIAEAKAAMIMLHGRGADAADILALSDVLARPDIAYLAPEAADNTWYPHSFLEPVALNEPGRSSALDAVADIIGMLIVDDILPEHTALLGFSQGACLVLEFAARNPRRFGAVIGLTGGLIGDTIDAADYSGSLDGTPVFVGTSDVDPHVPLARVKETAEILRKLGGDVTERIYPGMGHTINEDEVAHVREMVDRMMPKP